MQMVLPQKGVSHAPLTTTMFVEKCSKLFISGVEWYDFNMDCEDKSQPKTIQNRKAGSSMKGGVTCF